MKELYNFSNVIKELRLQNGYSQKYVADILGIKYQSYQNYEYGLTMPSSKHLLKLADLYDVSIDYLYGRANI